MALNSPERRGLRVFHNSNTAQRVEIVVPAGAELSVPVEVAGQMHAASSHFEVDDDEFAKARAEADELAAEQNRVSAEARFREDHRITDEAVAAETVPQAKPRKRAAKARPAP